MQQTATTPSSSPSDKDNETASPPTKVNSQATAVTPNNKQKKTMISLPQTRQEYEKAGVKFPTYMQEVDVRETFDRTVKGVYTRKVYQIRRIRMLDGSQYLDWDEVRYGQTAMGRKLEKEVSEVTKYRIPIPYQELEFNPETEEHQYVTKGEKEQITGYCVTWSQEVFDELVEDIMPYKTQYQIVQIKGADVYDREVYTVTKQEIQQKDFESLFKRKAEQRR